MTLSILKPNFLRSILAGLLFLGSPSPSIYAEVVGEFSGGLGSTSPTQFPGTSGRGWSEGWQTSYWRNKKEGIAVDVKKESAFKGDAEVLVVSRKGDEGFLRVSRTLDAQAIDPTASNMVTFQIRVDEFSGSPDQPFLFTIGGSASGNKNHDPRNAVWSLGISTKKSTWAVYHRNEKGDPILHQTPVPLELGVVYSISVRVSSDDQTFQVTIDSDSQSYQTPPLPSPKQDAKFESIFFAGWVADNGTGNFRWSLGPVRVQPTDAQSKP